MNNKKKVLQLAAVLGIGALALGGTSLAYFTDKSDVKTNTFTVGNVAIDLEENFDSEAAKELKPAVGSAQAGTLQNGIKKEVWVENTGSEEAYVRVHIAIPKLLDNNPDASKNILHFNYSGDSIGVGKWDWSKTANAPYEGDWNTYETTIDGVEYTVYVVTHEKALETDEKTPNAIKQVYLDSRATQEQVQQLQKQIGDDWNIIVKAEAVQADGFTDAYTALNEAFGAPSWN